LTNGSSSPVFEGKYQNDQAWQSFDIKDYSLVKRVKGTTTAKSFFNYPLDKLSFSDNNGTEITTVTL
jgi:hypothetical protein